MDAVSSCGPALCGPSEKLPGWRRGSFFVSKVWLLCWSDSYQILSADNPASRTACLQAFDFEAFFGSENAYGGVF
jgi:hypothetical protein